MIRFSRALGALLVLNASLAAQGTADVGGGSNRDPDAARLVTTDIPRFWQALDRGRAAGAGLGDSVAVETLASAFQRLYLDSASAGLRDFAMLRIRNARTLARAVHLRPRFYDSIRETTLSLDSNATFKHSVRTAFRRLKALYPEAVFPDVYFVMGRLNSGGTASQNGLLIGVEINARSDRTEVDELNDWERLVTGRVEDLPYIVAHELVHVQAKRPSPRNLLSVALREGNADFVAELIAGGHTNRVQHAYGLAHERALWLEFEKDMDGQDTRRWLYNGASSRDRPADLGYFLGYRICQAYYERATNKAQALADIIRMEDPDRILAESRYADRWLASAESRR